MEKICIKCQILFSGKNKKNITNLSSAEFAHKVVTVKGNTEFQFFYFRHSRGVKMTVQTLNV